ncbi:polysaccharide deacetylase family protein [Niabella sp. CC-SYL272]|uniref:polysaccharide deacetylase family protein n=1 Tax=Niabella agricola TaxID=2891571 RepID=UPI001F48ECB0|nr:polysaccharide deacetylase family protein [Niabella agricola]MCF3107645.1 polysaccharide deacetylase family protein [Niabella agricola]
MPVNTKLKPGACRQNVFLGCFIFVFLLSGGLGHKTDPIAAGTRVDKAYTAGYKFATNVTGSVSSKTRFRQPPVLCYHQVRNWVASDAKADRSYIVPVKTFHEQMSILNDSGYRAVLPDQWIAYRQRNEPLPQKTFILTFDDGTRSQFDHALPELDRLGYKAVFFIMTVAMDKNRYMTRKQIRRLAEEGHVIGCHTWDHHDVRFYKEADWQVQLVQPARLLEAVTGRPVRYFAYPFGSWNAAAVKQLINNNYKMGFQLYGPLDRETPEFTVRRILVDGGWSANRLMKAMAQFKAQNP